MTTVEERTIQGAPASVETTHTVSVGERFVGQFEDGLDEDRIIDTVLSGGRGSP